MANSKIAGSDALPKRMAALGTLIVLLCSTGLPPLTSVFLAVVVSAFLAYV
ncbi:MAG: hypothetical protein VYC18_06235 [Pseudomonadota bacterium]|nr:hypothetical protein [Pseudomonadota bacterium]